LDIGCREGATGFVLHHIFGIPFIDGLEREPLAPLLEQTAQNAGHPKYIDHFDLYQQIIKPDPTSDAIPELISKRAFSAAFHLQYGTDAANSNWPRPAYDMILCSNVLHYLNKSEFDLLAHRIKEHIRSHTLIYMRIKARYKHALMSEQELEGRTLALADELDLPVLPGRCTDEEGMSWTITNF